MLKLFKRKRVVTGEANKENRHPELPSLYKRLQIRWAKWMARRTARLSKKNWTVILLLFVLLSGGYSGYLIINSLYSPAISLIRITHIRKPACMTQTGDPPIKALMQEVEFQRIRRYKQFMDSLARSPDGSRKYDSILYQRPGLMDSIQALEQYYHSQKK